MAGATAKRAAARKSVHVPVEGEYLTDGRRLVEVLERTTDGYVVLDVTKPLRARVRAHYTHDEEMLSLRDAVAGWALVEWEAVGAD